MIRTHHGRVGLLLVGIFSGAVSVHGLEWDPEDLPDHLHYGSYFGGEGQDGISAQAVGADGCVYLAGETRSATGLPLAGPDADTTLEGESDAFIAKLAPDGKTVIYCTLLGGNGRDYAQGMVVDGQGQAYVVGSTWSDANFPATSNALERTLGGGRDAFVAKYQSDGRLEYCTYLGGPDWDYGFCVDTDADNTVYVGGFTHGSFPVTAGAAQTAFGGLGDGFVAKVSWQEQGTALTFSTYLGGKYWESVSALNVHAGEVHAVTDTQSPDFPTTAYALDRVNTVSWPNGGSDGSFTVLSADGTRIQYSTFFGAEDSPAGTAYLDIVLGPDGSDVFLLGVTDEPHFQTTENALLPEWQGGQDAVLVKLKKAAADRYTLEYSTYLGGPGEERPGNVVLDAQGDLWVSGSTTSPELPPGYPAIGGRDLFLVCLDAHGRRFWAARWGGSGNEGQVDSGLPPAVLVDLPPGALEPIWVSGVTDSPDLPTSPDAFQSAGDGTDGFISRWLKPDCMLTPVPTPGPVTATPTRTPTASMTATSTPTVTSTSTATPTVSLTPTPSPTAGSPPAPNDVWVGSYWGGPGEDRAQAVVMDPAGNLYIAGITYSHERATKGSYQEIPGGNGDVFVAKINALGQLLACTYVGGSDRDYAEGICLDADGQVYLTGSTWSPNFPTTNNALDRNLGGGRDAFVAKLDSNLQRLDYSTFLGGEGWDYGFCLDLEISNAVVVGGFTHGDFPVTAGAAQSAFGGLGDGFVAKLAWTAGGSSLVYSTYLGGRYYDCVTAVAVINGEAYVALGSQSRDFPTTENALDRINAVSGVNAGSDGAFVVLAGDGRSLRYSTFWGPENSPHATAFHDLHVSGNGEVVTLAGYTDESEYPTTTNAMQRSYGGNTDAIIVQLVKNGDAYALVYSSFAGGAGYDVGTALVRDGENRLWVTGITNSVGFPAGSVPLGSLDIFTVCLGPACQLLESGRYGGAAPDGDENNRLTVNLARAYGEGRAVCLAGNTGSGDFPVTDDADQRIFGGGEWDGYILGLKSSAEGFAATPASTPTPGMTATTMEGELRAYPNPGRDRVRFTYWVEGSARVVIDIYRLTGERVAHISERVNGGLGMQCATEWEAYRVAPGIYLARVVVVDADGNERFRRTKKIAIIR